MTASFLLKPHYFVLAVSLTGLPLFGSDSAKAPEAAAPSSGLVAADAFIWGINGHPQGGGGVYTDERGVGLKEQFELVKKAGCTWYRFDVFARDAVPGKWKGPDELDAVLPAAEAAGVEIYPALYPPIEMRPYDTLHERMTPEEIYQASYDHAKAAAAKWKGRIKVWDLLNEPDGWAIMPDRHGLKIEDYDPNRIRTAAMILKGQSEGIKAGDPGAKTSLNNGGWLHTGFIDAMIAQNVPFDILSWHWYSEMGSLDKVEKADNYPLLEKLEAYGKPIWIGEVNKRPKIENTPPDWLKDFTETMLANRSKGVEAIFYYELLDLDPEAGDAGYGFIPVSAEGTGDARTFKMVEPAPKFDGLRKMIGEFQKTELTSAQ